MHFGLNIKYLRALKGLTQAGLAEAMKVKSQTVTGWESGKSYPNFLVLVELRKFFKVDLERMVFHDLAKEMPQESIKDSLPSYSETEADTRLLKVIEELKDRMTILEKKMEGKRKD